MTLHGQRRTCVIVSDITAITDIDGYIVDMCIAASRALPRACALSMCPPAVDPRLEDYVSFGTAENSRLLWSSMFAGPSHATGAINAVCESRILPWVFEARFFAGRIRARNRILNCPGDHSWEATGTDQDVLHGNAFWQVDNTQCTFYRELPLRQYPPILQSLRFFELYGRGVCSNHNDDVIVVKA